MLKITKIETQLKCIILEKIKKVTMRPICNQKKNN
jgi:hypothetical protein